MNSTKTISDKKYSVKPFFKFIFYTNWQHFMLYLIIMFLAVALPCVMLINDYNPQSPMINQTENIIRSCGVTGILSSAAIAVFAGMSSASYVNSKQMVGAYHSFPIKREWIFISETSIRAIYYIISMLVTSVFCVVLMNLNLPMTADLNAEYLKLLISAIMCFILVYSVFLLAGGLTGTSPVRFIVAMLLLYLPTAIYALIVANAQIGISNLSVDYYLSNDVMRVLCSTYRMAEAIVDSVDSVAYSHFANIFIAIPEAMIYYVGALLLHKYRKSESSGTTIVWKPVFAAVKYLAMFTAALLGIFIFGSTVLTGSTKQNTLWVVFGLIVGLVLSFIILNSILYRSSKAMFRGIGGLLVVSAVSALFMVIVTLDVFGLNTKIYSAESTKELQLVLHNSTISFTSREEIDRLVELLDENNGSEMAAAIHTETSALWNSNGNQEEIKKYFHYSVSDLNEEDGTAISYDLLGGKWFYIGIVQKPKFGIPLAKGMMIYQNSDFWSAVSSTDEYKESAELLSRLDITQIQNVELILGEHYTYIHTLLSEVTDEYERYDYDVERVTEIFEDMLKYCTYDIDSKENSVLVGMITAYYYNDDFGVTAAAEYPVYADNLEVVNRVCEIANIMNEKSDFFVPYPDEFRSVREYFDFHIENCIAALAMIDTETGEIRIIDKSNAQGLLDKLNAYSVNDSSFSTIQYGAPISTRYLMVIVPASGDEQYYSTRTVAFRNGAITDTELEQIFNSGK